MKIEYARVVTAAAVAVVAVPVEAQHRQLLLECRFEDGALRVSEVARVTDCDRACACVSDVPSYLTLPHDVAEECNSSLRAFDVDDDDDGDAASARASPSNPAVWQSEQFAWPCRCPATWTR